MSAFSGELVIQFHFSAQFFNFFATFIFLRVYRMFRFGNFGFMVFPVNIPIIQDGVNLYADLFFLTITSYEKYYLFQIM